MKLKLKNWIERLALWLLTVVEVEVIVVSSVMHPYVTKIEALCREEEPKDYGSTDAHGDGYFKTRRVMAMMLRDHPELVKFRRDLLKAIVVASERIAK